MPIELKILGAEAFEKIGKLGKERKDKFMSDLFVASQRFGNRAVAIAKKQYLLGPRPSKILSKGQLKSHINTKTVQEGNVIKTSVGSDLVYSAIQEFGGTTHPTVTSKMRAFAWAMFRETKNEKFKRMALTKKSRLTINIPARPYIRPAIEDAMPDFRDNIARVLQKISFVEY